MRISQYEFYIDISIPHIITFSAEHKDLKSPFLFTEITALCMFFLRFNYHIGEHGEMGQVGPIASTTTALSVYGTKHVPAS